MSSRVLSAAARRTGSSFSWSYALLIFRLTITTVTPGKGATSRPAATPVAALADLGFLTGLAIGLACR